MGPRREGRTNITLMTESILLSTSSSTTLIYFRAYRSEGFGCMVKSKRPTQYTPSRALNLSTSCVPVRPLKRVYFLILLSMVIARRSYNVLPPRRPTAGNDQFSTRVSAVHHYLRIPSFSREDRASPNIATIDIIPDVVIDT